MAPSFRVLLIATSLALVAAAPASSVYAASTPRAGEVEILDFFATWCGPCQQMKPVVESLTRQGFPIRQVDIDRERALAAEYRVNSIPCLVAVSNGKQLGRIEGVQTEASARRWLAQFTAPTAAPPQSPPPATRPSVNPPPPSTPQSLPYALPTLPVSFTGAATVETLLRVTYPIPADKQSAVTALLRTHPDIEFDFNGPDGMLRVTAPPDTHTTLAPTIQQLLQGPRPTRPSYYSGRVTERAPIEPSSITTSA